ncbi:hypothetical protein GCK72_020967 [Caenorhabditis remanei]|uniref:BTB domain-containing protein n=1 Tax=Caenorhabditis remanei TaxID=31234 RepID=A0A6A5GI95_CAERE|nr:hypothetical protein GCK72_020967 [Caenorhabditis remanei]KAF1754406.1 hypothetical protein GCK72_020967 [Caenorhabditis remanei]
MSESPVLGIYESTFAPSDKTDAVVIVGEKKLHVNKALLSYHSDYIKMLFNISSSEKSPPEILIEDVNFEHFATVLSLIQCNPIEINKCDVENLLELAEQFELPLSKFQLELYLIGSGMMKTDKIRLADKFGLNELFSQSLPTSRDDYMNQYTTSVGQQLSPNFTFFKTLSKKTTVRLFHQLVKIKQGHCMGATIYKPKSIYESTYAQSDKTDAILVVEGRKLHVNKAVLSYHSDYFNTLFNGDFKEQTTHEIQMEFDEMDHKRNAEKILELADRFLLLPSVKRTLEQFIISSAIGYFMKFRIADKYNLEELLTKQMEYYFHNFHICNGLIAFPFYENMSDDTKVKLFNHMLKYA